MTASVTAASADTDAKQIAASIIALLPRLHVLVVGPGLGRDPLMQDTVAHVVRAARDRNMPVVLDADALLLVQKDPGLVRGYKLAVLTPNVVEFGRLAKALEIEEVVQREKEKHGGNERAGVEALATKLDGVTVVQKGAKDFVSDGTEVLTMDLVGGKKRSGGQGDTLTGAIATFLGWRKAYLDGLWETGGELREDELVRLAAFGGSAVTRVSACSCCSPRRSGTCPLSFSWESRLANSRSTHHRNARGSRLLNEAAVFRLVI
jgi:ATP-dependent NAD(P)H-hydrate dehydratase